MGVDRKAKEELMARLERDAQRICARFRLRYRVLEPERANVKRRYGVCFSDGTIRIRLIHVTTKQPLKYSSLVNTLCHELAHLRHFNHGPHFQEFYATILEWARREGIYRPGPAGEATGERPQTGRSAAPTSALSDSRPRPPVRAQKPYSTLGQPPLVAPVDMSDASRPELGRAGAAEPPGPRKPKRRPKPASAQLELFG